MRRELSVLPLLLLLALAPGRAPAQDDPWVLLDSVRGALVDAAWEVDFHQSFVPAGFAAGESESGRAILALPSRLRWDYETPFPRTFLVREDTVYTWNPGETEGRRFALGSEEVRHLELLRLDVDALRRRYDAAVVSRQGDAAEVRLTPREEGSRIVEASLEIDADGRLSGLGYRDAEGNETRFTLSGYRPSPDLGRFTPPEGIAWIDS